MYTILPLLLVCFLSRIYILGDTSYGECCVDEVAAEHIGADGIIHFGHVCLTPTHRIPALYVFTVLKIDTEALLTDLNEKFGTSDKVALVYDVQYHHALSKLQSANIHVCPPHPPKDDQSSNENTNIVECGRLWPSEVLQKDSSWNIVYVGQSDNFITLLRFTFVHQRHFIYDPKKNVLISEGPNVTKTLMKRYFMVEK